MENIIRHLALSAYLVALALAAEGAAHAQSYPERPVRFIFGLSAGSSSDTALRIIGQKLFEQWQQPAIIDNRTGASGNIAAEMVAKAAPDGYTLLFSNVTIAIAPSYFRKLAFDPIKDYSPVGLAIKLPHILCVNPSLPVKSIKDLVALAKSRPGELRFSSAGSGQTDHMAMELFAYMAGIKMVHVPYRGGPQALNAVMSGEVALDFPGLPVALPLVKAGKLRALAASTTTRAPAMPEVPTMAEAGVPGYEHSLWSGVFAPARTPPAIVSKVSESFARAVGQRDVQERFAEFGIEGVGSTPAQFDAYFKAEVAKWMKLISATGIRSD